MSIPKIDRQKHICGSWNHALEFLSIALVCAIVFLPYLFLGAPYVESYYHNINWSEGFIQELQAGTAYPRWLPNLWDGVGAADFFFYAPLPYYLIAGVNAICGVCDISRSIAVTGFLIFTVSGIGMLGLMRALSVPGPILLGAISYVIVPFHFGNWSHLQAVGTLTAMAFLPFFLTGLVEAQRGRGYLKLAIATALLAFSHLPTLLVAGLTSAILAATVLRPASGSVFLRGFLAATVGLAAAAVYWLPAVSLLETVNTDALRAFDWRANMLRIEALELSGWNGIVWVPFLALSVVTVLSLASASRPLGQYARVQIVLLCAAWFFVTPLSAPVWEHTQIDIIQFPWRFLVVADVAFAMTIPVLWARTISRLPAAQSRWIVTSISVIAMFLLSVSLAITWERPRAPRIMQTFLDHKVGATEWLGRSEAARNLSWHDLSEYGSPPILRDPRDVRSTDPSVVVDLLVSEPRLLRFRADCPTGCTVVLRRGYWTNWKLWAEESGHVVPIAPTMEFPLITAVLPAGDVTYRLSLQRPLIERVAMVLSITAILTIFGGAIHRARFALERSHASVTVRILRVFGLHR